MKAVGKVLGQVKSSNLYRKLFVVHIDYEKVEEMKLEMRVKYPSKWWF